MIQETGQELMLRAQDLMIARKEQSNIVSTIDTLNLCIPGKGHALHEQLVLTVLVIQEKGPSPNSMIYH